MRSCVRRLSSLSNKVCEEEGWWCRALAQSLRFLRPDLKIGSKGRESRSHQKALVLKSVAQLGPTGVLPLFEDFVCYWVLFFWAVAFAGAVKHNDVVAAVAASQIGGSELQSAGQLSF